MKLSEALITVANWLESPDNQVLLEAKSDEDLEVVADVLMTAADIIKSGAEIVKQSEPMTFDDPKYKWVVYDKNSSGEDGMGKVIAEFEATFDEGDKMIKDLAGHGAIRNGNFGKHGGHLIFRSDDGSVAIEGVAEPIKTLTPESLDEMAAIAQAFDESGDELLQKQASVID